MNGLIVGGDAIYPGMNAWATKRWNYEMLTCPLPAGRRTLRRAGGNKFRMTAAGATPGSLPTRWPSQQDGGCTGRQAKI